MADPTNRNDPTYANDPKYVFSGGRWQYRGDGTVNPNTPPPQQAVHGESLGTTNPGDLFTGLADRIGGTPFKNGSGVQGGLTPNEIPNYAHWQQLAQQNAPRQQAVNPYNTGIADQSRAAQLALIQQMRGQMNGPSIANMQGQRAMGAMGQQALMQGGRAGMLGAQGGSAGLAGDVGQARLAEVMKAQAGMGGAAGSLRGNDIQSANAQMGAGLSAQQIEDARPRFYAGMGSDLSLAQQRNALENFKLTQQMKSAGEKTNSDMIKGYLSMIAMAGGGSTAGGGGSAPTHGPSTGSH